MKASDMQTLDRLSVEVYKAELVKSNKALVRLSRRNKQLRARVRELHAQQQQNKFFVIMRELYDKVSNRINGCTNCKGGGSCHSPEKCQSKQEKQNGESTLPTAPPLS